MRVHSFWLVSALTLLLTISPCGLGAAIASESLQQEGDETDAMFEPDRLLDIHVEMDESDWERLRYEHHNLFFRDPKEAVGVRPNPYTYYHANVTIDGERMENVGIRMKGLLGSVNAQRPSIKLHFDKFEDKQRFSGLEMMTLNNNDSDVDQMSQYLSYFVFRKAGLPAPRCSFARVTVNGRYLGVYSHVESVRKRFLKRNFGSSKGTLYEGQISDFRDDYVMTFENKRDSNDEDRADLARAIRAVESSDDELLNALGDVFEIDSLYRYLACECLVGFWDSYSGNKNNYFVYRDPSDNRFRFIPWGTDSGMTGGSGKESDKNNPHSIQANATIPFRIYQHAEGRERYREVMRGLLDRVWDEDELLAEINRIEAMLKPHMHLPPEVFEAAVDELRLFVEERRELLGEELDGDAPEWTSEIGPPPWAGLRSGFAMPTIQAEFEAKVIAAESSEAFFASGQFDSLKLPENAKLVMEFERFYEEKTVTNTKAFVVRNNSGLRFGFPTLYLLWQYEGVPGSFGVRLLIDPGFFKEGKDVPVDGYAVLGYLIEGSADVEGWTRSSWVRGKLSFEQVGDEAEDFVIGNLELEILGAPRR